MKRRGNGEGTIRQRKDGLWTAQIRIIDPFTGLTKRESLYARRRVDVMDKLRMLQHRIRSGEPGRDARMTVSELMDRWLADVAKPSVKPNVYNLYNAVNEHHLKPALGDVAIGQLQPAAIERALTGTDAKGSARMRQLALMILKAALKTAVRWRLIARSPGQDVKAPTAVARRVHPLSPEQVKQFLDAARSHRLYALFVVAIFAGARQGEILALRWKDVDLEHGRIRVRGTLDARTRTVTDPKTARSHRTIAVPPLVCSALKAHRSRMRSEGLEGVFTFVSEAGTPLSARNIVRAFKGILVSAGLAEPKERSDDDPRKARRPHVPGATAAPTFRFQDLRHTYATLSLLAGIPLKVVSEQLGHSSIQITADTYTHILPAMTSGAASVLGRFYSQRVIEKGGRKGRTIAKTRNTRNTRK